MKRIGIISVLILAGTFISMAQNHKVVSAYNQLRNEKLEKALEAIEPATEHKKTKDDAKTWYYRGNIYLSLHLTEKEEFKDLVDNPLKTAYDSYKKSLELDEKEKFVDDVNERMQFVSEQYFNKGVNTYKEKKYETASESFERAAEIAQEYMQMTDTTALYYTGNSADLAGNKERALKYYKKAKELNFDNASLYTSMTRLHTALGDTAKALEVVKEGKKRYDDNFEILIAETNIYLAQGDAEKALENLKVAVEKDTTNPEIWFAVGTNYDNMMKEQEEDSIKRLMMEEAVNAYEKALELKPDYFKPAFNLGAIYVNRAAELQSMANNLPLSETEKYEKMKKEADSMLQKAMPMLEKAHEIDPDDVNTMNSLKEIYARLNKKEKREEISKKLEEATQ
ncbi:MAG: tetratricopeptide repeat protein [Bacteroidota bacterium]